MEVEMKKKLQSRTWLLTIFWNIVLILSLVLEVFTEKTLPTVQIVSFAGAITMAYLAKRAVQGVKKEVKKEVKNDE